MEFAAGILKKETLELPQILEVKESDREILVEGTVHSIRNMGEIALEKETVCCRRYGRRERQIFPSAI